MDGIRRITKKYQTPKALAKTSADLEFKGDCLYAFASAADLSRRLLSSSWQVSNL